MPDDDDEPDHRRSATTPAYADPDSDLDSDLDSIPPPQPRSPSHPPLPSLTTTTTAGSPVRSTTQTSPKGKGLRSPLSFGSPPPASPSGNLERQLISHPQTPPPNPQNGRTRHGLHQHGSSSPSPSPSPSSRHLPPASTLYHLVGGLGLGPSSPLSPFRRQFSAPLQAVRRSSSRAPSFASITGAGSRPSTSYGTGTGSGSGNTFFTHVNDSRGTVHHLAIKDGDDDHNLSFHEADDELSDDDQQHPLVRVDAAAANQTEEDDHDLAQDRKDVLVERLTDLIHHLQEVKDQTTVTSQSVLGHVSISELHAKVDEMEAVLAGKGTAIGVGGIASGGGVTSGLGMAKRPVGPSARASRRGQRQDESEDEGKSDGEEGEVDQEKQPHSPLKDMLAFASSAAPAAAPSWLARSSSGSEPSPPESRAHSPSPSPSSKVHLKLAAAEIEPFVGPVGMTPVSVAEVEVEVEVEVEAKKKQRDIVETECIAAEAEKLAAQLEVVLRSLEKRREESNHVHALLVERAEAAASRILDLEQEVADLEDEISCQESELKHLRLELRAIETLVNEFLPPVEAADPELVRSIENWKADWKRLREQMLSKSRRKSRSKQNPDGHDGHEEGRQTHGKERKHQHDHEVEHEHHKNEAHETHELSVVMEVTGASVRQGHHHQHSRNGNGVVGGDGQGDDAMAGAGSAASASAIAPAHAVRVSRTGA
ncbi:hypothetical protein QBC32DRAFT_252880 [Pseudoneurospora amorphoporcata]|uniref:Uncharacterized protein n=1 Tax=Pseudoneurospora amorphoporcata TaxID=241081 RepID=A0AAN6SJN9_9PEZI|nr:hypothetical protein QBC32DRAFT_252880 [Pseudoneurospora amorphoporcata]